MWSDGNLEPHVQASQLVEFALRKYLRDVFKERNSTEVHFCRSASASLWIFVLENRPKQSALRSSSPGADQAGGDAGSASNLTAFLRALCCARSVTCNDRSRTASPSASFVSGLLLSGAQASCRFINFAIPAVHSAQGKVPAGVQRD